MTIGRPGARKNDIELNDDTVSKQQASIYYDNTKKQFTIKNESTTNPTMVDKNVVTESAALENGSQIEMGKTVLKFKME
jgi:predicted component of type VI protein secretion system